MDVEISDHDFSVNPNPSNGEVSLIIPTSDEMYTVNIFDLTGKPVNSFQTKSGSRLNLLLPAGVYIVSLTGSKGTLTKKLIVH